MALIPPMDDEAPTDYVAFVITHAAGLRAEAARLVGGAPVAEEIFRAVLTDLAGHWRRLRLLGGAESYLRDRLAARAGHWREDQVYEVEVRVLRPPEPLRPMVTPAGSLALRKAALLPDAALPGAAPPDTTRADRADRADAEIAWVHAYLAWQWRRVVRYAVGSTVLVGAIVQYMSWLSGGSPPT